MARNKKDEYVDIVSNDPKKKRRRKNKKGKAVKIISIILIVLSVLSVASVLAYKYGNFFGARIDSKYKTQLNEKSMNILLCGIDFEENSSRAHLTDVQMVVSIDIENKKANVLQIPRDTYVGPDETSTGKINAIYSRGESYGKSGMEGLIDYIYNHYKLPIDHYATVNMTAFRRVIDGIGGVEMDVPFDITLEGVTIEAGKQVLDGEKAEKFVRKRKGSESIYQQGDLGRMKMQRLFMAALVKGMKNLSVSEMATTVTNVIGDITTDMTPEEAVSVVSLIKDIDLDNMVIEMLPGESLTTSVNGWNQSVYTLHKEKTAEILNKYFRPHADEVDADQLDIIELQNTHDYFEDTADDIESLLDPDMTPGEHKEDTDITSSEESSVEE